jgi:GGDEF domain-containing protein
MRDFARAVSHAADRGDALALARISLANPGDSRLSIDAARIVARLVRASDFACRDADGTILVAFTDTQLGPAHVVARRIASVLKHTALAPGRERGTLDTSVAIAALNSRDTADTLIARVAADSMVAAS